ncbi:MAG: NAD(P)-binding protein, partial [Vallitaleaceae bacterium]|nr:NAD(P)-binding protein [Vallitaleaceae bacterium]
MKLVINNMALDFRHSDEEFKQNLCKRLEQGYSSNLNYQILKKSMDARKKPQLFWIYSVLVEVEEQKGIQLLGHPKSAKDIAIFEEKSYVFPVSSMKEESVNLSKATSPIVIGSGPAGLFAAYLLAKAGRRPLLLERGGDCEERHEKIQHFYRSGELDLNSNIQFGEGGAGTYSDGKLNTGVKDKFLRKEFILKTFVEHGADPSILYMNKPHVGTDYLMKIVVRMREEIIRFGGEVHFNTQVTDLIIDENQIQGVVTQKGNYYSNQVILAIGHSARDTFRMLKDHQVRLEAKPFAIGLRIEHPQRWINRSQYGAENESHPKLKAADYKLTYQSKAGRGVYSFCMCPGGYVVNASSHPESVVCNGMSYFARDH